MGHVESPSLTIRSVYEPISEECGRHLRRTLKHEQIAMTDGINSHRIVKSQYQGISFFLVRDKARSVQNLSDVRPVV